MTAPIKVLLIEDNPGDARLITEVLKEAEDSLFDVVWREALADGLEILEEADIDIILLDLSLPDSTGLDTLDTVWKQSEGVPILVLTGLDDKKLSLEAVKRGAQDYLIKEKVHADVLERCIKHAIDRQELLDKIRASSLMDPLTGLYNRRGFVGMAKRELKLANRHGTGLLLFYIDIDDFKRINDTLGHQEGDRALVEFGEVLRLACRETDLLARIGGDEFLVLIREGAKVDGQVLPRRIQALLVARNQGGERLYDLGASIGIAKHGPGGVECIDELICQADTQMYERKQSKRKVTTAEADPERS